MLTDEQLKRLLIEPLPNQRLIGDGNHQGKWAGDGSEPGSIRPYEYGDDWRWVDYSATARTASPTLLVRPRIEEHGMYTMLALDLCGRNHWVGGGTNTFKTEVSQVVGQVVIEVLARQEDMYGLYLVGETQPRVRPSAGVLHKRNVLEQIQTAELGGEGSLGETLGSLCQQRIRMDLVVVCSDFLTHGWEEPLRQLARFRQVMAVQVLAPWSLKLPNIGPVKLRHPVTKKMVTLDTHKADVRQKHDADAAQKQAERVELFRQVHARHLVLDTGSDWQEDLTEFLLTRTRRAA